MKFCDLARVWLRSRSERWTSEQYAADIQAFVRDWVAAWGQLDPVTHEDVEKRYEARRRKVSASRLNTEGAALRSVFRWGMARGLVARDPSFVWESVRRRQEKEPVSLSEEEEQALLRAAPEPLARLIRFALATGLRAGTLRRLTWEMIEERPDGPVLNLPAEIMKVRRPAVLPLSQAAIHAIPRLDRLSTGAIFTRLGPAASLSKAFRELAQATITRKVTFHDLRKTFATRLLNRGVPVHTVMSLGCWKSAGVLLKHYAARSELVAGRAALESALGGVRAESSLASSRETAASSEVMRAFSIP